MELTLRQDAINETFADVEKLVFKTIHEFISMYGGDFHELLGQSGLCFAKAYNSYDRSKGALTTHVRWRVWHGLLEYRRQVSRYHARFVPTDFTDPNTDTAIRYFDVVEFLDELSEDAKLVVKIALADPWQFSPEPKLVRRLLREYLKGLQWTPMRIGDCFKEIRQALGG